MKTLTSSFLSVSFLLLATFASAQTKTEKLTVSGECGMCKKTIETAAKLAGASSAVWNADNKVLTVKYDSRSTNTAKIEKTVAASSYDTEHVKASDAAYEKLHACCKYDRAVGNETAAQSCCDHETCKAASCMKDGKCSPDMSCCKEAGCDTKACCKKA